MRKLFRGITIAATMLVGSCSLLAFAGCDTKYPEVTITYEFNGKKYEVDYVLTRNGAPQTVQHFLELADAGFYDDTVIHDYQDGGLYIHGGGYTLDEDGELEEIDYWTKVKELESAKNMTFTQTVFRGAEREPLYTLRGEFSANGVTKNNKSYYHNQKGTLVMYYMDKGQNSDSTRVSTLQNDGKDYREQELYSYNSATSMFYTYTSSISNSKLDAQYCAFGRTKDYEQLEALISAVNEVSEARDSENPFIITKAMTLNQHDPFTEVRDAKIQTEYNVPDIPIIIKSVKVKKY